MTNGEELKQLVVDALDDLKAVNTVSLDVTELTDVTDYLIIASGTSNRHVKSLAVTSVWKPKNKACAHWASKVKTRASGSWWTSATWWSHVMLPATRDFYDLERLWVRPETTPDADQRVGGRHQYALLGDRCRYPVQRASASGGGSAMAGDTPGPAGQRTAPSRSCQREGARLLKAVADGDRVVALDVGGRQLSTEQLAGQLREWQMSGDNYSLLIGWPGRASSQCIARCRTTLVAERSNPATSAGASYSRGTAVSGLDNYGQPPVSSRLILANDTRNAATDHPQGSYRESRIFSARTITAITVVLWLLGLILSRYYSLQVTEYQIYKTQSERNRVQLQPLPPKRGLIYDRNGVLLADNRPSYFCRLLRSVWPIWSNAGRGGRHCCRFPTAT